ncbi:MULTISPECIES: transcriptional regulator [unclassified Bradyrhizobium]|jgi:probable addiction module antidote protein|uniref:transcriptional regulator n=1 Tax=unclassified Bradyrhizobium TaxID=2631580 RepID=UPI001FF8D199|nr:MULTISPECIES: transcriptional regulator [unclassified Bradyrhizobium]MCK1291987.1 transcriptional regulator [Bradyrhizobium sp. 30]MCK1321678.1 transcriptional regulator [Bradyrhizobium sp. 156]MCK1535394.1 transcriptional regulator [Bradyrhizobium sp. 176]MCK1560550.1 transcriptional regulator [Bradyrhizobium sp. 171]MCK1632502.1 transcriptional regulator [Bradyrhizobium sp. 162]
MLTNNKAILAELFRDNSVTIATYLTEKFSKNDFDAVRTSLSLVMQAQNVQMLARGAGLRRDTLYRTFGGRIDPQLSRVLGLFRALNVQACVVRADASEVQSAASGIANGASEGFAKRLTQGLASNRFEEAVLALKEAVLAQNVSFLAREAGIERRTMYKTFGGAVDPNLSRILKVLAAMQLRLLVVPLPHRSGLPRPKLGRPPKASKASS